MSIRGRQIVVISGVVILTVAVILATLIPYFMRDARAENDYTGDVIIALPEPDDDKDDDDDEYCNTDDCEYDDGKEEPPPKIYGTIYARYYNGYIYIDAPFRVGAEMIRPRGAILFTWARGNYYKIHGNFDKSLIYGEIYLLNSNRLFILDISWG